ncbi:biotin synthase [Caldicellulosiruptor bescii]|uniref:Biotin synthase n=2 Tax=Caldicellulosiruptor bescii TaxID=31899 RepID=BIOB_CALBD|nr:biotin synthase BioB [Caldicellulosiruptor bescii]B9MP50.1 RecName: Full=Biotin synthase [Caldicellulosiruptor bescii DSM 6725]ACM61609.1 biotin synthase [Caldicellulosiruptor bescii DSM 6725]PBC88582.1 biotin synthase [Caldicellulosiruptor bescii]PBC91937.1 biotin synthase [Caldicellulosiruptor bescii]PBD02652.1 biotin synthase [Caldicellulosiruptor bescii]PBD05120.1 biotin synthase [Caldicellulosiruptor bescii]
MLNFLQSVQFVKEVEKKIIEYDKDIAFNEAIILYEIAKHDADLVKNLASTINQHYFKNTIELCSIYPAKVGLCPQDCKFCSQSIHHSCLIEIKDLAALDEVIEYLEYVISFPIKRFCLVTSGEKLDDSEFEKILDIYSHISKNYNILLCASLGFLTQERAKKLLKVGVVKYHNNLETSSTYFKNICSTHTQQQKIETLKIAKEAGLQICSGGIISMGEDMIERIKLAFELRELDVDSVPINILNPIKGTPLEDIKIIDKNEIFITLALFRIVLPKKTILLAGGKENALGDMEKMAYECGVNGCMVGNYLTTRGMGIREKIEMLESLDLKFQTNMHNN